METKLRTRIIYFICINILLFTVLYFIPTNSEMLTSLCIFKKVTGNECWNCGMTRAFLSILHLDFEAAYQYNQRVILVFPLTLVIYIYSWYKYIFIKGGHENE